MRFDEVSAATGADVVPRISREDASWLEKKNLSIAEVILRNEWLVVILTHDLHDLWHLWDVMATRNDIEYV